MMELFEDWQKSIIAWLCTTHSDAELSELFKDKFSVERTAGQFFTWRKNHKIKSGRSGLIGTPENPRVSPPKGIHLSPSTEFKKGHKPANYKPVGSETVNHEGYTIIKVGDKGTQRERWRFKSRLEWEKSRGKIGAGEKIIHIDGDKTNDDIGNLRKVDDKTLLGIIRAGGLKHDREINNAVISVCEIESKLAAL